ncbi:MAG: hypothetical protein AAFY10_08085 [Pseudomonadota bacterium]
MKPRRIVALAALLACLTCPAVAEGPPIEDSAVRHSITGSWTFKSYTGDACDFGGVARLSNPTSDGVYDCELTARQVCPVVGVEWVVRQSCIANRTDDRLIIRSTIEEFIVGEPTPAYWPDNFVLKIRSGDLMTGSLVSHGSHASEFTRQIEGIS